MVVRIDITILYWFIGFNTAFKIFRDAFPILNYLYIGVMAILAARAILNAVFSKRTYAVFPVRLGVLLTAIICSAFYSLDFFSKTLSACLSVFLICLICLKIPEEREWKAFLNGYKVSLCIDFAYALVQAALHVVGVEINQLLFNLLNIEQSAQLNFDVQRFGVNASTRVTGLIWDPYVIGMYCVTAFFLFDKKWLKVISIVLLLLSQSRAGLLAAIAAFTYYYWPKIKERKRFIAAIFALIVLVVVVPNVVDLGRGFDSNSSGWRRVEYITLMPQIFARDKNLLLTLFGGSPAFTGAKFYFSGINSWINRTSNYATWSVESDWLGMLYGQGIVGIISYFSVYHFIIKNQPSRIYRAIAIAILFGGIGYYYYTAIFANMLLMLPCCYFGQDDRFEEQELI